MHTLEELQTASSRAVAQIEELSMLVRQTQPAAFAELAEITNSWIDAELMRTVRDPRAETASLGGQGMRALAVSVRALTTNIVEWFGDGGKFALDGMDQSYFENAFYIMTGALGSVLYNYGFIKLNAEDSVWSLRDSVWSYQHQRTFEVIPKPAINRYLRIKKERDHARVRLLHLRKEIAAIKAQHLPAMKESA